MESAFLFNLVNFFRLLIKSLRKKKLSYKTKKKKILKCQAHFQILFKFKEVLFINNSGLCSLNFWLTVNSQNLPSNTVRREELRRQEEIIQHVVICVKFFSCCSIAFARCLFPIIEYNKSFIYLLWLPEIFSSSCSFPSQ